MTDKRTELKGKEKFLHDLSLFLEKNKIILFIILAVIVAAIIIVAIIDSSTEKKANQAAFAIEQVQKDYDAWTAMADDDSEKAASTTSLFEQLDAVISDYNGTYAEQRAFFLKGNIKYSNDAWSDAAEFYSASAEVNRDSYLAPISLMLQAASLENAENYSAALSVYIDIYENYDGIYPDVPHAMLSIGRLYELTGDNDSAVDSYNNLIDKYPGSGWSSFARTRIIQLD